MLEFILPARGCRETNPFMPQGLCTCCSLYPECSASGWRPPPTTVSLIQMSAPVLEKPSLPALTISPLAMPCIVLLQGSYFLPPQNTPICFFAFASTPSHRWNVSSMVNSDFVILFVVLSSAPERTRHFVGAQ